MFKNSTLMFQDKAGDALPLVYSGQDVQPQHLYEEEILLTAFRIVLVIKLRKKASSVVGGTVKGDGTFFLLISSTQKILA